MSKLCQKNHFLKMYNLQKQSYRGIQKVTITTIEMKVNKTIIKTLPRRIHTFYTFFIS